MNILVVDNYDSFVWNVIALLRESEPDCCLTISKNDEVDLSSLSSYDGILLSPGPGLPSEAGLMPELIRLCADTHSVLGICLGHQAIAECFGAKLKQLQAPLHGLKDRLHIVKPEDDLLKGLSPHESIGHYHSWVVASDGFPECLEITSRDENGEIMSLRHKTKRLYGLQFHPESYITSCGAEIIRNWLQTISKTTGK